MHVLMSELSIFACYMCKLQLNRLQNKLLNARQVKGQLGLNVWASQFDSLSFQVLFYCSTASQSVLAGKHALPCRPQTCGVLMHC